MWLGANALLRAVTVEASATQELLCQVTANYGSRGGDSGAPVFIWYPDHTVYIAGVHSGITQTGRPFFSKFDEPR